MMKEQFAKNLRYLRIKHGKNQTELGIVVNKAHTTIGNWEKCISEPSMGEVETIASYFEIPAIDILFKDLQVSTEIINDQGTEYDTDWKNKYIKCQEEKAVLQQEIISLLKK